MKNLNRSLISVLFLLLANICKAQSGKTLSGRVLNKDQHPLPSATITLKDSLSGRIVAFGISNAEGRFTVQVKNIDPVKLYLVIAGHIQTLNDTIYIRFTAEYPAPLNIQFVLYPNTKELKEVIIKSAPLPFAIRGDTIEFKVEAYKTPETRKVQDVLKNIQGFSVGNDGKISFNGKPLEKILIDGEDLTDKNYTLISKNLNAEIISRIQVLNNFNDDRLMKEVETSGNVGINLITDSSIRNRLSGSVEIGYSPEGRMWSDNNLILLTRKIKVLGFLNYNETGRSGNEDLDYYYDQGMPGLNNEKVLHDGPVNTGQIYPPDIGRSYTRDNRDFSSSAIASFRSGEFTKWKMLISDGHHKLSNGSGGYQHVFLTDQDKWTLHSREQYLGRDCEFIARLSLAHDRKKINIGSWNVQFINFSNRNNYSSLVIGAFSDTLHEYLNRGGKEIQLNGYESFSITPNTVMKFTSRTALKHTDEDFEVNTLRYGDIFIRFPPVTRLHQLLKGTVVLQESDLRVSSRWKKLDLSSGIKSSLIHFTYSHDLRSLHINDPATRLEQSDSKYISSQVYWYGVLTKKFTRKSYLTGGGSAGIGYSGFRHRDNMKKSSPVFRIAMGYEYRPKPLARVILEYKINRTIPLSRYFFPDPLINANATLSSPADQIVFPQVQSFSVQYVSQNLYRSSGWQITASYNLSNSEYISSMFIRPAYAYHFFIPVSGNRQWNLMAGAEKFHSPLKLKSVLQSSLMRMKNKLVVNGVNNVNDVRFLRLEGKLLSAFKGWLNFELVGVLAHTWNTMKPEAGEPIHYSIRQHQGYVKLRCRFSEKFYIAVAANMYDLAGTSAFHSVDAFLSYAASPKWLFTLNAHNLLNSSSIIQRYTALNSESEQRYDLVGRYILLKVAWSF